MSNYTKKEDVVIEIERFVGYLDDDMLYRIKLALDRLPDIEIVRCKDCKWYMPISENYGKCTYRTREHLWNEPSDYCSYGKQKEQEQKYKKL